MMKRSITTLACILAVCFLLGTVAWAGDGQIDIAEIPYTISGSGSYIVVDDLSTTATDTNGITIEADNVTLDLNGHALIGPGNAAGTTGHGIYISATYYNTAIHNGTVRDWREDGVSAYSANGQYEALRCYNNGGFGLRAINGSRISDNTCLDNGDDGISAGSGCTVTGNTCYSNDVDGISASYGCTVSGNTCSFNTGDGIQVSGDCRVADNTCRANGSGGDGAGIYAADTENRISNNHCTDNDRGLDLDNANNIVSGNTLLGNTTTLDAVAGNQLDILISELPYTISQPGMYRLTGDLSLSTQDTDGIIIDADNVTLDLNGHALIGPGKAAGTTGDGIDLNGTQYNITIRNGTVRDWRADGVNAGGAENGQFEALHCYNNGDDGIAIDTGCTVIGSTFYSNGDVGIYSGVGPLTVSGNTCYNNGGDGIYTGFGCTVTENACRDNTGDGINSDNSSVRGNACYSNTGDGIEATNSLVAENCSMANGTNLNLTTCTAVNNKS